MNFIRKVIIENFQSHEYTLLEFSEGLNVIVGPSDQGKSAIIRAVKWALFNEPRGMDFIRTGTSSSKVTVEFSNNYTIIRERSKSKNRYQVVDPEKNVKTFEGFGNEVPQEVVHAHGIKKMPMERGTASSLNIAEQLEGPFLLIESGSTRAKAIGRLVGVHIIDRAIKDCAIDLRRNHQTVERIRYERMEIGERLREFEELIGIEERLWSTESILKDVETVAATEKRLVQLKEQLGKLSVEEAGLKDLLCRHNTLEELEDLLLESSVLQEKWLRVNALGEKLSKINQEIYQSLDILDKTQQLAEVQNVISYVRDEKRKFETISDLGQKLGQISANIINEETVLKQYTDQIGRFVEQYSQLLRQMGICPFCRSNIREKNVEEIIFHLMEEI